MTFPPIALVGHGCVLPGALDPGALWDTVVTGRTALAPVPADRWGVDPAAVRSTRPSCPDRTCSDVGGHVRDFDSVFRPRDLGWNAVDAARLDPVFRWTLHAVGAALDTVPDARHSTRTGLVMGNLTYPTFSLARSALRQWRTGRAFPPNGRDSSADPLNRFSFGHPAVLAGRLLGLGAGTLTLDGACASSLYALKIACDRLHDGTADVMVAGGVSGADNLFIHMGFTALGALSPQGRSLPLDRRADGLVPAEGAAFVALMRLSEALARDVPVLAVVRGIAWTNNGRRGGLLAPDEDAQERAIREAYRQAGLAPSDVGLLECHATGTPLGDTVELRSSARVFADARHLPIGAAKANFGHTLSASGAVGLLKLVAALRAAVIPPVTGIEEPVPALASGPFRLPRRAEEWTGRRVAGLSAFGFGGSNAHLVVEAGPDGTQGTVRPPAAVPPPRPPLPPLAPAGEAGAPSAASGRRADMPDLPADLAPATGTAGGPERDGHGEDVVVVGLGVRVGSGTCVADFVRDVTGGPRTTGATDHVRLALDGLHFPPADFADAHPQQPMLMAACQEAVAGVRLPGERTMVVVGTESTPDSARFQTRWRPPPTVRQGARDGAPEPSSEPLTANAVVRHMGAAVANQINVALDLTGPGFALSERETSGLAALRLAVRAIRAGESDAAVVGAVATADEDVHRAALAALGRPENPVDAAVVIAVKRAGLAERDGDRVLAVLPAAPAGPDEPAPRLLVGDVPATQEESVTTVDTAALLGHADCAHGMVSVALAVAALSRALLPRPPGPAAPWLGERAAEVVVRPADSVVTDRLRLRAGPGAPRAHLTEPPPRLHVYSGADSASVTAAARSYQEDPRGPARLVVQARGTTELRERTEAAVRWLRSGGPRPAGVHHGARPLEQGTVAFVYTGGAATYHGMGRALAQACPEVLHTLAERCGPLDHLVQWLYEQPAAGEEPTAMQRIWASSMLSRLHTSVSRDTLGLRPHSVIGYSSGAASALISLDYWRQLRPLVADAVADPLFNGLLTGPCDAVRAAWRRSGVPGSRWAAHLVGADPAKVAEVLAGEPAVHLTAVNSPSCCTVGGEESACERVLAAVRPDYAFRLEYDIAIHAPEVAEVADRWRKFHHRQTTALPGVRFYDCATGGWQYPTDDGIARALTAQATGTVDFAGAVRQAYADGVRVFVEHGPKQLCTNWISETLAGREHLAVALDSAPDRSVHHLFDVAARLAAAGVAVDHEALTLRFTPAPSHLAEAARTVTVATCLPRTPRPAEAAEASAAGAARGRAAAGGAATGGGSGRA
ncbi:beta-ketoacyl synthase N-terminal-like domain-containing protein, partial [Streptomyces gobitricini]|uniref:beta-ketoacyl synthase N-terminal-like domain-containing protein n=1 Tax=Streptomyces gobitricini TaxID=68211 RepID=UPI0031E44582